MSTGRVSRRSVVAGTAGLAILVGVAASRLAGTVVRRGASIGSLVPGKPRSRPVGFSLSGPDGARYPLVSRRGAPFLLHVWATWCPPCRHELPALEAFMQGWGADCPVVPVAVSSGAAEDVRAFLARSNVSGLPAWTVGGPELKDWYGQGELAIPVTFLIDGSGRVRALAAGSLDWADPAAPEALRRVLAGIGA
ncbi:TlpA family protein disulfide reductase [Gluconobacter sp.]|uniref:TlpA family protein disulfide reductase n=1 Tax=Gluconobacter sp. TaxID=1876758 RepID=UPI0039E91146